MQPATSHEKSHIFLLTEGIFLSVAPGAATLEFGETSQRLYSITGELTFPMRENLTYNAAFIGVGPIFNSSQNQMRCGAPCHGTTLEYSKQCGVTIFASQIVRLNPSLDIPLDELKGAWKKCSTPDDPTCQPYNALFDESDLLSFEFNEDFPFFGSPLRELLRCRAE